MELRITEVGHGTNSTAANCTRSDVSACYVYRPGLVRAGRSEVTMKARSTGDCCHWPIKPLLGDQALDRSVVQSGVISSLQWAVH